MCGLWVFWGGCVLLFFMVGCSAIPPLWGCVVAGFYVSLMTSYTKYIYYFFIYRGMCIYRTYDKYIVHIDIIFFNVHICTLVLFYVHEDKIVIFWGGVV